MNTGAENTFYRQKAPEQFLEVNLNKIGSFMWTSHVIMLTFPVDFKCMKPNLHIVKVNNIHAVKKIKIQLMNCIRATWNSGHYHFRFFYRTNYN